MYARRLRGNTEFIPNPIMLPIRPNYPIGDLRQISSDKLREYHDQYFKETRDPDFLETQENQQ